MEIVLSLRAFRGSLNFMDTDYSKDSEKSNRANAKNSMKNSRANLRETKKQALLRAVQLDTIAEAAKSTQQTERKLTVTTFSNKTDAKAQNLHGTWADFCEWFSRPETRKTKDGELFSPATFKDNQRSKANAEKLSMLVLDFDHGLNLEYADGLARGLGVPYAIYTSFSHQRKTDKHPMPEDCFRVVIPLHEPIPADDVPYLFDWANGRFFFKADKACKDAGRMFYLPVIYSQSSPFEFFSKTDGEFLDWRPIVEAAKEAEAKAKADAEAKAERIAREGLSPFDDYAERGDIRSLLVEARWEYVTDDGEGEQWRRPGKRDTGFSAHLFHDSGVFHVFSDSAAPFKPNETYTKPQVFALLKHGGDESAAARALMAQGFGEKPKGNGSAASSRFNVTDDGVYYKKADEDGEPDKGVWLCSPLRVTSRTRDENGENTGLRLEWTDFDGNVRHWTMPRGLLAGDGAAIREELLSRGFGSFAQWRGANAKFIEYLQTAKPEKAVKNTSRIGWHNGAYILPDETIGAPNGEETVLQSSVNDYRLTVKGSLEDWQSNVSKYCEGNSRLLFAASVAFAAPLLRPLGQEGGGFHFRGQSSKGKSTTTIVAGSIYGGGDPLLGFARTWASTANALEATAEMHNDGLLILDELARCDAKDAGNVAYMLASGDGKGRLQSSTKMRKPFKWQLMFLSTGEVSLADHAATAGKKTRAGQEVRLCDLPADTGVYGVFENLHGFADGAVFAKALQQNSRAYYGAPLRAYLAKLTQGDLDGIKRDFLKFEKYFTDAVSKIASETGQQISGEVSRVASRFALVAYAGELATSYGVTGWAPKAAKDSALKLFKEWIENRGGTGNADEEAAVAKVRQFLAEYGSIRFESERNDGRISGKRAGFVIGGTEEETRVPFNDDEDGDGADTSDDGGRKYCIFTDVFKTEVCAGYDTKMVAQALHKRGFLEKGKDGKNPKLEWSPTEKRMVRVYVVSSSIFGE